MFRKLLKVLKGVANFVLVTTAVAIGATTFVGGGAVIIAQTHTGAAMVKAGIEELEKNLPEETPSPSPSPVILQNPQ